MTKMFKYYDKWETETITCPKCGWSGVFKEGMWDYYEALMDSSCPKCKGPDIPILAIVSYPTLEESEANWDRLSESERASILRQKESQTTWETSSLKSRDQLPDLEGEDIVVEWDFESEDNERNSTTVLRYAGKELWREPACYEGYGRFAKVVAILRAKYGRRLRDVVPTSESCLYLYGDKIRSIDEVAKVRKRLQERNRCPKESPRRDHASRTHVVRHTKTGRKSKN